MVFYFLITIVFIAEIIITAFLLFNLLKWSKTLRAATAFLQKVNPKIKEIMEIGYKISEQIAELAPIYTEKVKMFSLKLLLDNLKGLLAGFLFFSLKKKKVKVKRIKRLFRIISALCVE